MIARRLRAASPGAVSSPGSDRAIQCAETVVVETMGRSVLDSPPTRGMTGGCGHDGAPLHELEP